MRWQKLYWSLLLVIAVAISMTQSSAGIDTRKPLVSSPIAPRPLRLLDDSVGEGVSEEIPFSVTVGPNVQIDSRRLAAAETTIAHNRINPLNLVAGAINSRGTSLITGTPFLEQQVSADMNLCYEVGASSIGRRHELCKLGLEAKRGDAVPVCPQVVYKVFVGKALLSFNCSDDSLFGIIEGWIF